MTDTCQNKWRKRSRILLSRHRNARIIQHHVGSATKLPRRSSRRHVGGRAWHNTQIQPSQHQTSILIWPEHQHPSINQHLSITASQSSASISSPVALVPSGVVVPEARCVVCSGTCACDADVVQHGARFTGMNGSRCSSWRFFLAECSVPSHTRAFACLCVHVRLALLDRSHPLVISIQPW